jgi:hypothetical protein
LVLAAAATGQRSDTRRTRARVASGIVEFQIAPSIVFVLGIPRRRPLYFTDTHTEESEEKEKVAYGERAQEEKENLHATKKRDTDRPRHVRNGF